MIPCNGGGMADLRVLPEQRSSSDRAGAMPKLSGDLRPLIPKLGLRNYWYPAIPANRVGRRIPVQVKMMGEDICFFRGVDGHVVAIGDVCPHRGARLSKGHCHWKGTVSCHYHGWVFDEHGKNVVVLGEGPDSRVAGKQGTEARVYPTRTLKNVVFVWIGDEEPAAIEEDVAEEFFDPRFHIFFNDQIVWNTSWEVALENSTDAHVNYLHRDHLQGLLANPLHMARGATGSRIAFTGNGFRSLVGFGKSPPQDQYPNGWKWPRHRFRKYWAWFFSPFFTLTRVPSPPVTSNDWWSKGHRLPGMFRAGAVPPPRPGAKRMRMRGGGLSGDLVLAPVHDLVTLGRDPRPDLV